MYIPAHLSGNPDRSAAGTSSSTSIHLPCWSRRPTAGLTANHIPMRLASAAEGAWQLRGHVARANPLWRLLPAGSAVLAVFRGADTTCRPAGIRASGSMARWYRRGTTQRACTSRATSASSMRWRGYAPSSNRSPTSMSRVVAIPGKSPMRHRIIRCHAARHRRLRDHRDGDRGQIQGESEIFSGRSRGRVSGAAYRGVAGRHD